MKDSDQQTKYHGIFCMGSMHRTTLCLVTGGGGWKDKKAAHVNRDMNVWTDMGFAVEQSRPGVGHQAATELSDSPNEDPENWKLGRLGVISGLHYVVDGCGVL